MEDESHDPEGGATNHGREDLKRVQNGDDWQHDRSRGRENHVISQEKVLLTLHKNRTVEIHLVAKVHRTGRNSQHPQKFYDIREWWYKDGPTAPPIPKKAGCMVHQEHASKVVLALMQDANPGEFSEEMIAKIRIELTRLSEPKKA